METTTLSFDHTMRSVSHYPRRSSVYCLVWRGMMEHQVPTYQLPGQHFHHISTDAQCPHASKELLKSRHFAKEESAFIGLETDITVMRKREQFPRKSLSVFHLFLEESFVLFCLLKNSQNHQCLSQDEYFNLSSFLFFYSCCVRNFPPRNSSFPHQFWSVLKLNLS